MNAVYNVSIPVRELDVGELNTVSCQSGHRGPIHVDVQAICRSARDKVLHCDILKVSTTTVRFDHHGLVSTIGVDILVYNVRNSSVNTKTSKSGATALVAPDSFDQHVRRRRLDCDTFVAICHLDIMYPVVRATDVDTVRTSDIGSSNDHIVNLAIGATLNDQMELGCS